MQQRKLPNPCNSVKCYLSHEAYYFYNDNIKIFFRGIDNIHYCESWSNYQRSYILLIHFLRELKEYGIQNFTLYNDSRLVEEMELQIEQLTDWGKGAFIYIDQNCMPYFVDYKFIKIDQSECLDQIYCGEKLLDKYRRESAAIDYNQLSKRRLERFKNESADEKRKGC